MKKSILIIVTILVIIFALTATACATKVDGVVKIGAPDGAPLLSIAELYSGKSVKYADDGISYDVVMTDQISTIVAKLTNGEYDMAILPTNVAANAYNKGCDIKLVTVNTWGNLYMVGKGDAITDVNALCGKVVYLTAQSGVPTIMFKYILTENGVEWVESSEAVAGKVALAYADAQVIIPSIKQNKTEYAVLGEPAVTKACLNAGASVLMDLQQEYKDIIDGSQYGYTQASLVARADFLEKNGAFVEEFIKGMKDNASFISEQSNLDAFSAKVEEVAPATSLKGITTATAAKCSAKIVTAEEARDDVNEFLAIFGINVSADFYYAK